MRSLLFSFFLLMSSIGGFSQVPATEARAAYMLAEEAFNASDYSGTIVYLTECGNKLGKSNSKILYLKIMAEMELAKTNTAYYDSVSASIAAFEAAPDNKEFNEEKTLEVMKIKLKLKTSKEAGKVNEVIAAEAPVAARFVDSVFASFSIRPGISESSFNRGSLKKFDDKKGTVFYFNDKKKIGPTMVNVKNGVINSVAYLVKVPTDAVTAKNDLDAFLKSFPLQLSNAHLVQSVTPEVKNYSVVSGSKVVSVTYVTTVNEISLTISDISLMQ